MHAGIHNRPAVAIVERVDVDVIQHHRQRQANPQHALGYLDRFTPVLRLGVRVMQYACAAVHHAVRSSGVSV